MPDRPETSSALGEIRQLDYTVIYARNVAAMRLFYEEVMGFPLARQLSDRWYEYRIGSTMLAIAVRGGRFNDPPPPTGALSVQLALRVSPKAVAACAVELEAKGVTLVAPPTDHTFGHRTIFFRDPDGNVVEIYAEI